MNVDQKHVGQCLVTPHAQFAPIKCTSASSRSICAPQFYGRMQFEQVSILLAELQVTLISLHRNLGHFFFFQILKKEMLRLFPFAVSLLPESRSNRRGRLCKKKKLSKPAPARVQPMLLSLVQDQPRSPATRGHRIPKIKSLPQTPILIAMRNWFLNLKMPHCMKLA